MAASRPHAQPRRTRAGPAAGDRRRSTKVYPGGTRALDGVSFTVDRPEVDRHHRHLGRRQEHAHPLHQPAGRADRPGASGCGATDIVGLPTARTAPCAPAHRHDLPGVQPGRPADGDGEPAVGPPGLGGLHRLAAAPLPAAGHRRRVRDARSRRARRDCTTRAPTRSPAGSASAWASARALMQNPDLLLVDEPTASLDPKTARQIMRLIRDAGARARAAGAGQHPRRGARAGLRRPRARASRPAGIAFDGPSADLTRRGADRDLRRRGLEPDASATPTRTTPPRERRRLPDVLASAVVLRDPRPAAARARGALVYLVVSVIDAQHRPAPGGRASGARWTSSRA